MQIAHEIIRNIDPASADAIISLDYEGRFLRRKRLLTDDGEDFMVELPKTISLLPSDGIVLDDGRVIGIRAKLEMLAKITHINLMRMAWHIGNRHTPCQIEDDHLLIQQDYVLEDMLSQLGAKITHITNPFVPEGGAYGHGRTHSHHHQEHDH
jgi:urease accessory protein